VEIVVIGDTVLRQKAEKVSKFDENLRKMVTRMFKLMYEGGETGGVGLAAPQIGISKSILVYDIGRRSGVLVNPKIVAHSEETEIGEEGCLSVPGIYGPVKRYKWIIVEYQDLNGRKKKEKFEDFDARVIQHEMDHLDGILFVDKIVDWGQVDVKPFAFKYPTVVKLLEEKGVIR